MFDSLTERLGNTLRGITGKAKLSEENIQETLREVRKALLEADVALSVVKQFIDQVRLRAIGQEVMQSLSPGQAFVKIVNDELVSVMGAEDNSLNLSVQPPAVIMMAGLQGAGKTTSTAKLALWLKKRDKKKVMVVSTDVYRPAAIDQLRTLAAEADVNFFESTPEQKPLQIAKDALSAARKQFCDVLIVDTAGRLAIDDEMMNEIRGLHAEVKPAETLFVVDAMTGQDAAVTAAAFNEAAPLPLQLLAKLHRFCCSHGSCSPSAAAFSEAAPLPLLLPRKPQPQRCSF